MVDPLGGGIRESGSAHHQHLETSTPGPWEVLTENSGAPTINAKKSRWRAPCEVLPENPGVPTINARNFNGEPPRRCCRRIQERPPSTLETSMAGPLGGAVEESRSVHHQH
jgi:hypothetical protein